MFLVVLFLIFLPSVLSTCPPHSVQGFDPVDRCYIFKDTPVDYVKADEFCEKISGTLLSIPNIAVNTWIRNQTLHLFTPLGYNNFWIGANVFANATWSWNDGTIFEYQNWQKGQPATNVKNLCAAMYVTDGTWFSSLCKLNRPFICVVPLTAPLNQPEKILMQKI